MKSTCSGLPLPPMSKEWHDSLKLMTPERKPKRRRTITDKQRLDWVTNKKCPIYTSSFGDVTWWYVGQKDGFPSIRQAIDAAMRAEKGKR